MSKLRLRISLSLDGYIAGPNQSVQNPLGEGGEELHQWIFPLAVWRKPHGLEGGKTDESTPVLEEELSNIGATIMGRNMFGGHPGPWDRANPWKGWWGARPPFHHPVFVVTTHARPPLEMEGGTVFHFVDASPQEALDLAREAAGDLDVRVGGGSTVVRDFLAANLIDTLHVVLVPMLLGRGVRLWDGVESVEERYDIEAVSSPSGVTHLTFTRR
jgi:dihydrofolate reductase